MLIRPIFVVLLISVAAITDALPHPGLRAVGWTIALGLIGVALAYASASPAPFGRRATGFHAPWAWVINGFNFLGLAFFWRLWRHLNREDPWNEVAPGLVVGRRLIEADRAAFEAEGPWAVVDCTSELMEPRVLREQAAYLCLPALDGFPPNQGQLRRAVAWMEEQHAAGRRLYVHCAVGHGRSATTAAAWLLWRGDFDDVDAALQSMTERRRWISLRPVQHAALIRFLRDRGTSKEG